MYCAAWFMICGTITCLQVVVAVFGRSVGIWHVWIQTFNTFLQSFVCYGLNHETILQYLSALYAAHHKLQ